MEELIKSLSADGRAKSEELDRLQEKFKKIYSRHFFIYFHKAQLERSRFLAGLTLNHFER